jgi:WD40 repeat protein
MTDELSWRPLMIGRSLVLGLTLLLAGTARTAPVPARSPAAADTPTSTVTRLEHGSTVHALAYTRDGRRLITAGEGGAVRIWDLASGKLQVLNGESETILAMALDASGKKLVTGSNTGKVRLWDLSVGTAVRELETEGGRVATVSLSDDGRWLAVGTNSDRGESFRGLQLRAFT